MEVQEVVMGLQDSGLAVRQDRAVVDSWEHFCHPDCCAHHSPSQLEGCRERGQVEV